MCVVIGIVRKMLTTYYAYLTLVWQQQLLCSCVKDIRTKYNPSVGCYLMLVLCLSLLRYALLCVLSSFAIILTRQRELVALLLSFFGYLVTVNVLWLFLTVSWVGLQCVFGVHVFHDHTHFFVNILYKFYE